MSFHNDCAFLEFHQLSAKGIFQDFIISFNEEQTSIRQVLKITLDLFQQLVEKFTDKLNLNFLEFYTPPILICLESLLWADEANIQKAFISLFEITFTNCPPTHLDPFKCFVSIIRLLQP